MLKFSFLLRCPFPGPLAKEQAFVVSFGLLPLVFMGCWLLYFQVWNILWGKKICRTHLHILPWNLRFPSQSAFFSTPFRIFSSFFYVYCPGILVVLSGRSREKNACSIFLKDRILCITFEIINLKTIEYIFG